MAKTKLRLLLFIALLAGIGGLPGSLPAGAWSELSSWGQIGNHAMIDSRSLNATGVICRNDLAATPKSVSIEARDVRLWHASGYDVQTTSVQYLLYQELAGGTLDLLANSPLTKKQTEASGLAGFGPYEFTDRPLGPKYVVVMSMIWYDATGKAAGGAGARVSNYEVRIRFPGDTDDSYSSIQTACISPQPPVVSPSASEGPAQTKLPYTLRYLPSEVAVKVRWDGVLLATFATTSAGVASGTLQIPAAPMGTHTLKWRCDTWVDSTTYTIKPRIKVIAGTVRRGQTVDISLRGFAAREVVRIRWKKGTSWVELGRITTSSTGSANAYLKVPLWAPDGTASVRGDGTYGHAQTNAVTVSGGPLAGATIKTATPTATATTPKAIATETPATSETASPVAEPSETATLLPETATPGSTAPPATETPAPTETAPPEPTAVPAESPTPAEP